LFYEATFTELFKVTADMFSKIVVSRIPSESRTNINGSILSIEIITGDGN
jgi:hypothetical protein